MKTEKLIIGIFFIAFGILFLLTNFHILPWSIMAGIWKLWPLILILIGVDMLVEDKNLKAVLIVILLLGSFAIWLLGELSRRGRIIKWRRGEHVEAYSSRIYSTIWKDYTDSLSG